MVKTTVCLRLSHHLRENRLQEHFYVNWHVASRFRNSSYYVQFTKQYHSFFMNEVQGSNEYWPQQGLKISNYFVAGTR